MRVLFPKRKFFKKKKLTDENRELKTELYTI